MRRHSLLSRVVSSLVAVITVWCLGCSAFEPLLAQLVGMSPGSMMECSSGGGMLTSSEQADQAPSTTQTTAGDAESPSVHATTASAILAVGAGAHHAYECGCQSCHAPSPTVVAVTTFPQQLPTHVQFEPWRAAGVERAPLVPPPQATA